MVVRRGAGVEVLSGVGAFFLALVTWTIWLFVPLFAGGGCFACPYYARVVEGGVVGLGPFIRSHPGISLFILAFLLAAGAVAIGAFAHGRWHMRTGLRLLWSGSLLLPVLLSVISVLPLRDFEIILWPNLCLPHCEAPSLFGLPLAQPIQWAFPSPFTLDVLVLALGTGLCTGLAIIAAVAASRANYRGGAEDTLVTSVADTRWVARLEVLSGLAAFALALVIWALWFFAPVQMVQHYPNHDPNGPGSVILFISLVEGTDGLGNFIHYFPNLAMLILAFLVATGAVGVGAYLHSRWHMRIARLLLWSGSLLLPLLLSAISLLPLPWFADRLSPRDALPKLGGVGVQMLPSPDVLVLSLGASLCVVLAVLAMIAMAATGARRQPSP